MFKVSFKRFNGVIGWISQLVYDIRGMTGNRGSILQTVQENNTTMSSFNETLFIQHFRSGGVVEVQKQHHIFHLSSSISQTMN